MKNYLLLSLFALSLTACSTWTKPDNDPSSATARGPIASFFAAVTMPMRDAKDMKKSDEKAENEDKEGVKPSKNEAVVEPMEEAPEAKEERRQMEEEKAREAKEKRAGIDEADALVHEITSVADEVKTAQTAYMSEEEEIDSWEK